MHFDHDVSIVAAENGGFIVQCRENCPDKKMGDMPMPMMGEMKPYVAKDLGGVIKLLKEKLPEYSKMAMEEESHEDGVEDEVGGEPAIGKKYK